MTQAQAYQMYEEMQTKGKQKIQFHQKNTNPKCMAKNDLVNITRICYSTGNTGGMSGGLGM